MRGETLVLDEVQWAEDEERGSAWTRLMLGGEYRNILLLGAVEALPLVEHAFPQVDVRFFERKAPLEWFGKRGIAGLGPGTVVVAFSRRAVIGLAGELNAAPPRHASRCSTARCRSRRAARRSTASSPAPPRCARRPTCSGTASTCRARRCSSPRRRSSTGASGATSSRGRSRRSRAAPGRFGFHERGHVGVLTGVPWAHPEPGARAGGADAARRAARAATWATASSTPGGCGRSSPT